MRSHVDVAAWLRRVVLGLPLAIGAAMLFKRGHRTVFFVLALLGGPAIEVVARLFESYRRKLAENWPIAQARVESGSVSRIGNGHFACHRAELAYSYSVNNEFWPGFHARDFDRESEAWDFVNALKGKTVLVNYSPGKHGVSALTDPALRAAIPDPSVLRGRRWLGIWLAGWFPGAKR